MVDDAEAAAEDEEDEAAGYRIKNKKPTLKDVGFIIQMITMISPSYPKKSMIPLYVVVKSPW